MIYLLTVNPNPNLTLGMLYETFHTKLELVRGDVHGTNLTHVLS